MTRQQVIDLLEFYPRIGSEIRMYAEMLHRHEDDWGIAGLAPTDGLPRGNNISDPTAAQGRIMAITGDGDAMRQIEAHIAYLKALQVEIFREFKKLPYYQKQVIYYYYLDGRQWHWIARAVSYSERQCKRFRNQGIDNLCKQFDANQNIKPLRDGHNRTT